MVINHAFALPFPAPFAGGASRDDVPPAPPPRMNPDGDNGREDAMLIARMAAGDRAALGSLYDRLSRPLLATAARVLRDPREAEDVVHDVFLTMWDKAADYDSSRGSPFAWAVTLTRNRAIDRQRSRTRRGELLASAPVEDLPVGAQTEAADSAERLDHADRAQVVRRALGDLPAEQQRALQLAFFSGLTQQEIAERLQEPLGTIKARIRRGLLKLRDQLAGAL